MPKRVVAASREVTGGRGMRYREGVTTPSGRMRSAQQWTSVAAIAAQQQLLQALHDAAPGTYKDQTAFLQSLLSSGPVRMSFLEGMHIKLIPLHDRRIVEAILDKYVDSVQHAPAKQCALCKQWYQRMRANAGPAGRMTVGPEAPVSAWISSQGAWLDTVPFRRPRLIPLAHGRLCSLIASWGAEALVGLPDYTVVCGERAAGRVRTWRKKGGKTIAASRATKKPPAVLVAALLHSKAVPTALTGSGDHFYLPLLRRWVSPTELLRLFGVPENASLMIAVRDGPFYLSAGAIVTALGRSIQVGCALRALRLALSRVALPDGKPRYASACSGLDLFAVAMEIIFGSDWEYVHAAECRKPVATALAQTYAHQGLKKANTLPDACVITHSIGPSEIWTLCPPCEPFSKRNHDKSEEGLLEAGRKLQAMLWYPRLWRPNIILVENVEEKDAIAVVTAALLSIPGYTWIQFSTESRDTSDMGRARHIWVGTLDV